MRDRWESLPLGELCQLEVGRTPLRADNSLWDRAKVTNNVWLSIGDLLNAKDKIIWDSKEYISDKGVSVSKVVKAGTLLLSFRLTLGRLAFAGRDLFTNESIVALSVRNEKQISKKFLYYFLSFFDWDSATRDDIKVTGKLFNKPKLKAIVVHFPKSLAEQERIVDLLDKVVAITVKAKEIAEKNLKNTCEIFKSYLQHIFVRPEWKTKQLGELASKICSGATPKGGNNAYKSEGIPLIRSLNVHDRLFKHKNLALINEAQAQKLSRVTVEEDDILLNITGSVGRCCIVPSAILPARVNNHVLIIRVDKKVIMPAFLNYLLISKPYKDELRRISENSLTRQMIAKRAIAEFDISFPDIRKQQIIVEKLDILSLVTQKLMSLYQQVLYGLENLKNQYSMKLLRNIATHE